jgi:hypothetical protein
VAVNDQGLTGYTVAITLVDDAGIASVLSSNVVTDQGLVGWEFQLLPLGRSVQRQQALQRSLISRGPPVRPHLAGPVLVTPGPPFIAPPATMVGNMSLRRFLPRPVTPPPHLAQPVISHIPPGPPAKVIPQAIQRGQMAFAERFLPFRAHVPLPVIPRGPPVAPATLVSQPRTVPFAGVGQSLLRPYIGRSLPRKALTAPPSLRSQGPGAIVVLQAVKRPYVGRTVPLRPQVARPVISLLPPAPKATSVGQALLRPYTGRTVPRPHLAPPVAQVPFVAAKATIVSASVSSPFSGVGQALYRPYLGRSVPLHPRVAAPVISQLLPVRKATIVSALQRPLIGRTIPRPHLAGPIVPQPVVFIAPLAVVVGQAIRRAQLGRTPPRPHLASPVGTSQGPGITAKLQSIQRALIGRGGHIHLPPAPPRAVVRPGIFVYQAAQRELVGRTIPLRPRVAPAVISLLPPGPPALVRAQAISRALIGRGGHVHLPPQSPGSPVPRGTFVGQAIQRPFVGRTVPLRPRVAPPVIPERPPVPPEIVVSVVVRRAPWADRKLRDIPPSPHVAPPVGTSAGPGATIKLQSVARALIGRGGRVHLPPTPGAPPVRPGLFVYQALQRAFVGRGPFPPKHLAAPIVPPPVQVTPVPYGRFVYVAASRVTGRKYRDVVPPPHLAPAVKQSAGPGIRIVSQALRAPYRGRWQEKPPAPHIPPPSPPRPVRPGTFISQAIQRALAGRTVPLRAKSAAPLAFPVFIAPAPKVISQVLQRPYFRRTTPAPHLVGPVLVPPAPLPPAKIILAAPERTTERKYRDVPPGPHLAPPVLKAAGPGATVRYQAVARALIGRGGHVRVAPAVLFRAGPGIKVVSQALQRPFIGRRVIPAHLPPLAAPVPLPPALVVSQALRRPYVGRTVVLRPRSAPAVISVRSPGPPAKVVSQALARALRGRGPFPPKHLVGPVVIPFYIAPRLTQTSQALQRPYLGRTIPHPHVVQPIVGPVPPPPPIAGPEGPVNVNPLGPRVGTGPETGIGVRQGPGVGLGGPSSITVRSR